MPGEVPRATQQWACDEAQAHLESVGARGFEPPTSRTQTVRANQTAPRPGQVLLYLDLHTRQGAQDRRWLSHCGKLVPKSRIFCASGEPSCMT